MVKLSHTNALRKDSGKRSRKRITYAVVVTVLWAFVTELAVYTLTTLSWPSFNHISSDIIKVLLVGDPQLLGRHNTLPSVLGSLVRWDADSFLKKTHALAANHFRPDLTVFLGDNLDEGETATDGEFFEYVERFLNVFSNVNFSKAIIVPGDNDIGGERSPPIYKYVKRFDMYFKSDGFLQFRFLEFFKVNVMTQEKGYRTVFPKMKNIRVLLSHVPLTSALSTFANKIIQELQPHLVISAHDHISSYIAVEPRRSELKAMLHRFVEDGKLHRMNCTDGNVHEILVPTCSYRMGTLKIGYGALAIDPSGVVWYTVLWLPSRLHQLYGYIILGAVVALILWPAPSVFLARQWRTLNLNKSR